MTFKKGLCISLTVLELFGAGRAALAGSLPTTSISNEAPQPALEPKDNPVLASFCNEVTNLYIAFDSEKRYKIDSTKLNSFALIKKIWELSPEALSALDAYGTLNPHDNIEDVQQVLGAMANEYESALNAYSTSPDKVVALQEVGAVVNSIFSKVVDMEGADPRYEMDRIVASYLIPILSNLPIMQQESAINVNNALMNWICVEGLADPNNSPEDQRANIRHDYPKLMLDTYEIAFCDLSPLMKFAVLRAIAELNYGLSHFIMIIDTDREVNDNVIVVVWGTTAQNTAQTLSPFDTIKNIR